jgi:hypothetical protein
MIINDFEQAVLGWETLDFLIECDRSKCKERVGENRIGIELTV